MLLNLPAATIIPALTAVESVVWSDHTLFSYRPYLIRAMTEAVDVEPTDNVLVPLQCRLVLCREIV
jgi:hypothetical protein